MKWLEIGMALVVMLIIFGYVSGVLVKGKRMFAVVGTGILILGGHMLLEGYRMQMILFYALFAVILSAFIFGVLFRKTIEMNERPKLWKRITALSMGIVTVAAALAVPLYAFPLIVLPSPTGPHHVGTVNYHWIDDSRAEVRTAAEGDNREVMVRVWYPAKLVDNMRPAPYAHPARQLKLLGKGQPLYVNAIIDSFKNVKTHSYLHLPVSSAQSGYPVLLFSPGFGASNFMYTSMTENLASHGYIVVAVEHPYYTEIPTLFPDGRVTKEKVVIAEESLVWDNMDEHMQLWVDDIKFVLHRLHDLNEKDPHNILAGRLDLHRIGMLGHSFGGAAAAQVMHQDSRVLSGVNMDGFPFGAKIDDGLPNPFLYIQTSYSDDFANLELSDEDWSGSSEYSGLDLKIEYAREAAELLQRKEGILKNGGMEWVVPEADHMSFSDIVLYSPLFGNRDLSLLEKVNEKLLRFFDDYVKAEHVHSAE
ncbi:MULTISPECIES: alpha/beta hydrolase family protein [Paenibacillus]|uniref:Carboxylic ester hydrolase n=1 Tax=Paenibacillus woosongensis TaxID=307580 RepID=A0ABQ4MLS9_9BACL|nr:hypothetical protein [Paenibacillus woosongensis]GIP56918.1 carboxylic ester hydrolase [Paenibacillus woosongensis]